MLVSHIPRSRWLAPTAEECCSILVSWEIQFEVFKIIVVRIMLHNIQAMISFINCVAPQCLVEIDSHDSSAFQVTINCNREVKFERAFNKDKIACYPFFKPLWLGLTSISTGCIKFRNSAHSLRSITLLDFNGQGCLWLYFCHIHCECDYPWVVKKVFNEGWAAIHCTKF